MEFLNQHWPLIITLLAVGFASGYFGGLFGVGGGIITTPALYAVFQALGHDNEASLKTAIGTSLALIIVTSIRSLMTHHRAGHVDMNMLRAWGVWIATGAGLGGLLARWAPVEALTIIFAGGAFYIAWKRLFAKSKAGQAPVNLMRKRMKIPIGIGTGFFSSLMGIGGGALGVMVMTMAGRAMHQAIATSAGFGVAVAAPGVAGFILSGWAAANLPPGAAGFVNLPAFLVMALTAAIAAPLGARAAHRLKGDFLSKCFGVYVLVAAGGLAWDIFTG
ncbi:sulfite exporter TauE/SafE family protein [Hyphococcus flavus]|uniref:Probable membrane transporter protein n=1 Tax=Hyphococcus flavus TaxID=1866326 RepID=A0AAE9ZDM0_9PROT|nr:sulfite exporter TauE/SafE family protein [Hyphococcus flavus]WDI30708.1 sulfite exporter TauE/SafE family protein [Hyphococcus flavus]